MDRLAWVSIKEVDCDRIGERVSFQAWMVQPAEIMPEQPARVLGHRCSHGMICNQIEAPSCRWAGTLPTFDPFR